MANEIQTTATADSTIYAIIRNADAKVWQTTTSTFVTFVDADVATYDVALVEQGTSSGYYIGDFPEAINAAGVYTIVAHKQAGGSPSVSDIDVSAGTIEWSGTAESEATYGANLISLSFAKQYLKIPSLVTTYDNLINANIASASAAVVRYCRRGFKETDYIEYYSVNRSKDWLLLKQFPILSIDQITLNPYESTPEVVEGSNFCWSSAGEVRSKPTYGTIIFPKGFQTVKVEYTAGFDIVPADIQQAVAMIVSNIYFSAGRDMALAAEEIGDYKYQLRAAVTTSITIPTEVQGLLNPYRVVHIV